MALSFRDLHLKVGYADSTESLLDDFYVPLLERAVSYDRAAGYFSSSILVAIEAALGGFFARGGRIRMVCNPHLSPEDAEAISSGLLDLTDGISRSIKRDFVDWDRQSESNAPSSLLRRLISSGKVELKLAVKSSGYGIFHAKCGVFLDADNNEVAFSGSVNETLSGWDSYGNHEDMMVFRSWDSRTEEERDHIRMLLNSYWLDTARGLRILPASRLGDVFTPRTGDLTEVEALEQLRQRRSKWRNRSQNLPTTSQFAPVSLFEHQIAVLNAWENSNKRGLVSFVTGGGKTKVGLATSRKWLGEGSPVLVLVPGEILVEQWREDMQTELDPQKYDFVQVGAGVAPSVWRPLVHRAFEARPENKPSLILATYDSARTELFLRLFELLRPRLLVVADEVHAIAAGKTRAIMSRIVADGRLGLSATPQRHGDPEGTQLIFDFFGEILEPRFTIADAIRANRLVPYSYQIYECHLNEKENADYERLTALIRYLASQEDVDIEILNAKRRERANIIKSAEGKAALAAKIIAQTGSRYSHWLVYCNSVKHAEDVECELRGIGITPLTYNSHMNSAERRATLKHFEAVGGYLLAVHCLDQGVDIPCLNAALILASSTNPREFIQRRGRILRKSQGKFNSEIFDVVTLTAKGSVALRSEIERSTEIAESARNRDTVMVTVERLMRLTELTDESVEDEEYM